MAEAGKDLAGRPAAATCTKSQDQGAWRSGMVSRLLGTLQDACPYPIWEPWPDVLTLSPPMRRALMFH